MTQDEIIGMAKEAGFHVYSFESQIEQFNRFTKLVEDKVRQEIIEKNAPVIKKVNDHIKELQDAVKAEREACAQTVLNIAGFKEYEFAANSIRARGNT